MLRTWAGDASAFAETLADLEPSWGSETFGLAGGRVVLCGPGLYVNRAMAVGLDGPMAVSDFEVLEARSAHVGVEPAIEITPYTHADVAALAADRGYVSRSSTSALARSLDDVANLPIDESAIIEAAADQLDVWQETSALGWGHATPAARRASDAFARVAAVVDGQGFLLARAADDRRPIACASLTVSGDIATLGGMSTIPGERGRGVQGALIRHRLRLSAVMGCTVATTTAAPRSASERNLLRHGFQPQFTITTLTRPERDR